MGKEKNNKTSLIIIIVGFIMIVGGFLYAALGTDLFKDKKSNNEEKDPDIKEEISYSAVYENNGVTMKTYQKKETSYNKNSGETLYLNFNNFNGFSLRLIDNVATYSFFEEKMTITFNTDKIVVEANDEFLKSYTDFKPGTYKKVSLYSTEEYYKDNIGNYEFFDTEYNGKYKYKDYTLYAFQVREDSLFVFLYGVSGSSVTSVSTFFDIDEEGNIINQSSFGSAENLEFKNDSFIVDFEDYPDVSGEYKRESKITIDEAIAVY